jgi:hypothetical protein
MTPMMVGHPKRFFLAVIYAPQPVGERANLRYGCEFV